MKEQNVNRIVAGALAGFIATVPMTATMMLLHRELPWIERYPLPPRRITMRFARIAGIKHQLDKKRRRQLTLMSHFSYGAGCGAVYGALTAKSASPGIYSGIGYGLTVWAASYLGWLPALKILEPASKHPPRRNALMILSHIVWGASLETVLGAALKKTRPHSVQDSAVMTGLTEQSRS